MRIFNDILTDLRQGYIIACRRKVEQVGATLGHDWIGMALITSIEKQLTELLASEEKHPSTTTIEVSLATLRAHLERQNYIYENLWTPGNKEIYLNREISKGLDIPAGGIGKDETVFVTFLAADIWSQQPQGCWDEYHRQLLLPLIETKKKIMLESTQRPGWWMIIQEENHA